MKCVWCPIVVIWLVRIRAGSFAPLSLYEDSDLSYYGDRYRDDDITGTYRLSKYDEDYRPLRRRLMVSPASFRHRMQPRDRFYSRHIDPMDYADLDLAYGYSPSGFYEEYDEDYEPRLSSRGSHRRYSMRKQQPFTPFYSHIRPTHRDFGFPRHTNPFLYRMTRFGNTEWLDDEENLENALYYNDGRDKQKRRTYLEESPLSSYYRKQSELQPEPSSALAHIPQSRQFAMAALALNVLAQFATQHASNERVQPIAASTFSDDYAKSKELASELSNDRFQDTKTTNEHTEQLEADKQPLAQATDNHVEKNGRITPATDDHAEEREQPAAAEDETPAASETDDHKEENEHKEEPALDDDVEEDEAADDRAKENEQPAAPASDDPPVSNEQPAAAASDDPPVSNEKPALPTSDDPPK